MAPQKKILVILAHFDDELFVAARIAQEARVGSYVCCLYTTDGGAYGVAPERRRRESQEVLRRLGIPPEQMLCLGVEGSIPDGKSHERVGKIFAMARQLLAGQRFDEVLTMAWEGGHVDHDVAHVIARALVANDLAGAALYEFAAYNGFRMPAPFFRVMAPLPGHDLEVQRLSLSLAWQVFLLIRFYRSQWKTWMGLGPFCLLQLVVVRRAALRRLGQHFAVVAPHQGPLLYERMFRIPFADVEAALQPFVTAALPSQLP